MVKTEVGGERDIEVPETLAARYTGAAPNDESDLLTDDTETTPSQRMGYRSATKLPPPN